MLSSHPFHAGCSAVSWQTADGLHLFGRNLDFDQLPPGTRAVTIPRGFSYRVCLAPGAEPVRHTARYAAAGIGLMAAKDAPALYEGCNDAGLMGAQLYYRGFAHYPGSPRPGREAVQPPFLLFHLLARCGCIGEAARLLQETVTPVARPLMGSVPPLHWLLADRSGESAVIEPDRDGVHLYRGAMGVMTNSPGYPWHRLNLLNFAGLRDLDYDRAEIAGPEPVPCFSGSGAQGLPGDFSSPSRFVRLAFFKRFALPGADEAEGVARLFRLLQNAAFPLGAVRLSPPAPAAEHGAEADFPFDYTLYSSVLCAESRRLYWTTHDNLRVRFLELEPLWCRGQALCVPLGGGADLLDLTPTAEPPALDSGREIRYT